MVTRNEIREFLTSRRARITPEHAGLRTYGGARNGRCLGALLLELATTRYQPSGP